MILQSILVGLSFTGALGYLAWRGYAVLRLKKTAGCANACGKCSQIGETV